MTTSDVPSDSISGSLWAVHPRLRHDVVFAESSEGAFIRHADDGFVLKGRSAYRWISALGPHLTGTNTVADLCAGLTAEHSDTVRHLIGLLLERGFIRDRQVAEDSVLDDGVMARFGSQINFIEHHVDEPTTRFARFRSSRVLLMGDGEIVRSAALGLLRNGLRTVHIAEAAPTLVAEITACAADLATAGTAAEVRRPISADDFDVIIADSGSIGPARVAELVHGLRGDTVVLPVLDVAGTFVIGPATVRDGSPCWMCAILRLDTNLDARSIADLWRKLAGGAGRQVESPSSTPVARMIGVALAFDVFRLRTGCLPAETGSAVVLLDQLTLESRREKLLRHPACRSCAEHAGTDTPGGASEVEAADLSERDVHDRYTTLVAPHVGVFSAFHDEGLTQSPVKSGRIRLGHGGDASAPERFITAFDTINMLAARNRAVRAAALIYAGTLGPGLRERRFGCADDLAGSCRIVVPECLSTWTGVPLGGSTAIDWVRATSLRTQEACFVPVAAVYGRDGGVGHRYLEPRGVGGGAGITRERAIDEGLRSALAHRALGAAVAHGAAEIDIATVVEDPQISMLVNSATLLGHRPRLLRLPTDGLAEAVLAVAGPGSTAWRVAAGWSVRDAAHDALRDLVGTLQLGLRPLVDTGDRLLPELDPATITTTKGAAPIAGSGASDMDWRVRADTLGIEPLVVDTTPADLRTSAALTTVRVLLRHVSGRERR